jgi:hypothetical protein
MNTLILPGSNQSVENDLLIRTTWNASLTSKNLDKLKINVARLNSYFQGICGLKIFIFSKQEVKLNSKIQFNCK